MIEGPKRIEKTTQTSEGPGSSLKPSTDGSGPSGAPPRDAARSAESSKTNADAGSKTSGERSEDAKAADAGTSSVGTGFGPHDVKVGGKDQSGKEVTWVYWSTDDYAIYQWSRPVLDETWLARIRGLWSKTPPVREEVGISPHFGHKDQRLKYALIHRDLSEIYGLQQGRLARREPINREIARAIMLALEGRAEDARSILTHLKGRLVKMRNIEGRASYLSACMGSMLIILVLLLVVSLAANGAEDAWLRSHIVPLFEPELLLLKVIVCGALGAFLSVCLSIQQLEIDPETPRKVNRISGITRLVIGMAAGLVVYLAIGAGLVLSDALDLQAEELSAKVSAGILLLAVVAGFSEVFVPNILRRVSGENGTDANGAPKPPPAPGGGAPAGA